MRAIWITRPGPPEVLQVREGADPQPQAGEVRVRTAACGINFADIMARLGLYPDAPPLPCVVGYEVSGTIEEVGPQVDRGMIGRKVFALTRFGGYADTICISAANCFSIPRGISPEQAAALPVNYLTAYQALVVMGSLRQGQRILIHNGGSGVGLAAIDIGRRFQAEIFCTASSWKHDFLGQRGAHHLIDYRREDFRKRVMSDGKGVDLVMDPVGGDSWKKSFHCLAPTGRLVTYGISMAATGKRRTPLSVLKLLRKIPWLYFNPIRLMNLNKGLLGVNMGHLWEEQERVRGWMREILDWLNQGSIRPWVDRDFAFSEAAAAHHYIQDRKSLGKVLLKP